MTSEIDTSPQASGAPAPVDLATSAASDGCGPRGRCLGCAKTFTLRIPRYDKVSNHRCPDCSCWLYADSAGPNRGRYLCPITDELVTLGQTGVQLDGDYRLIFQPGLIARGTPHEDLVTEPYSYLREVLDRVGDRVLGQHCVVDRDYDPHLYIHLPADERARRLAGPGLRLVLVEADAGIEPIVNARLTYRRCLACDGRVPDLPRHRIGAAWIPHRHSVFRNRGRGRSVHKLVDPGPHPAGSLACGDCAPQVLP